MPAAFRIRWLLFLAFFTCGYATAQPNFRQSANSYVAISGTSTLNEWTMTSQEPRCQAQVELTPDGTPQKINALSLSVKSQSLKSGHSAMDKNAYNTLNADAFKAITFEMVSATVEGKKISCQGKLTVAGVTRDITVESEYRLLPNRSLLLAGSEKLKMSDFTIEAPTFMFGTVTTGDDITVSFNIELVPVRK